MAGDGQVWGLQRRPFSRGLLPPPGGLHGATLSPPPPNPLGKLARPASPAAVLSFAALDHLSTPVKPPPRTGTISLGRSASTPLVAGGLALSSSSSSAAVAPAAAAAAATRALGEAEPLPISTRPTLGSPLLREVPSRLKAFDRRLAQDFEELDEQRHERLTSAGTVRTHSPDRSDTGLSLAARRENFRKQQYEAHIDRARTDSAGSPTGANAKNSDIGDNDFLDIMKPEAFQAEIAGVERQFEEMARSLRLEHLSEGTQADRRAAEREAERRRKEEIMRRARKKEQEARDPKKKVAIRLENKRTFEREESEKDSAIPMTKIDVGGGFKGHEEVELVDVRRMRTKCRFMEGGLDVRQMVDTMARRERQERALHYGGQRSNLAAAAMWSSAMSSSSSASDMLELRRKFAQDLKDSEHVEGLLRKIGTMRNKLPYALPYKFEVLNNPMLEQVLNSQHQGSLDEAEAPPSPALKRFIIAAPSCLPATRYKDGMTEKQRDLEVATALSEHFAATAAAAAASHANSAKKAAAARGKLTHIVEGLGASVHAGAGLVERTVSTRVRREKAGPVDEAAEAAMKKRARRRWAIARAAWKVHLLYQECMERNDATVKIKAVLNQLGEWARIRKAMAKLRNSIKVLQVTCRAFLNTKKKRCGGIEKEWQRVEDHYLQTYFKTYAQRLVSHDGMDRHGSFVGRGRTRKPKFISDAKSQQEEVKRLLEAGVEGGELSIDWRSYRIPPKERKVMISRYYMMQLRKHVRSQKHFLDAVQTAVKAERELVRFLKLFGADDDQIRSAQESGDTPSNSLVPPPDQVEKANFWHISEEMLLQLVNVAAQAMRDVEPFRNHPANIDEYGHRGRRGSIGGAVPMLDRTRRKVDTMRRSALAVGDVPGGAADLDSHRGENTKLDVEEIFKGFTPRLREICEEQTIEYRNATAAGGGERAEEGQGADGGDATDVPGASGGAAAAAAGPGRAGPDGLLLGHANASQLPSVGGT